MKCIGNQIKQITIKHLFHNIFKLQVLGHIEDATPNQVKYKCSRTLLWDEHSHQ